MTEKAVEAKCRDKTERVQRVGLGAVRGFLASTAALRCAFLRRPAPASSTQRRATQLLTLRGFARRGIRLYHAQQQRRRQPSARPRRRVHSPYHRVLPRPAQLRAWKRKGVVRRTSKLPDSRRRETRNASDDRPLDSARRLLQRRPTKYSPTAPGPGRHGSNRGAGGGRLGVHL